MLVPGLAPAGPVAILGPTYAEHGHAWRKAGFSVTEVSAPAETGAAATVVVVNPNNPDGRVLPREELVGLAAGCAARGGLLVVDEAFADFTPEAVPRPAVRALLPLPAMYALPAGPAVATMLTPEGRRAMASRSRPGSTTSP